MDKGSNLEKMWVKLNLLKYGDLKFTIYILENFDNNLDNILFANLILAFLIV